MKKDRDASVDRLLAGALSARGGAADGACLDAETLAAWADGTLDTREQTRAEAHAADCARCQEVVAAMVKALPPVVAKSWWRMPALGWLVPLTAAATALVIWIAVPGPSPVQVSDAAKPVDQVESAPVPLAQTSSRADTKAKADAEPRREVTDERDLKKSSAPSAAAQEKREVAAAENQAPLVPRENVNVPEAVAIAPAAAVGGASAAPAPRAARAQAAMPQSADSSSNVRREGPLPSERGSTASGRVSAFANVPETIIVSSNPSTRFRLLRGGGVQRSADAGATWRSEVTGATETLTAGASPSPSVCWLIGQSGLVLLSTDGRSWRRLRFPETVDLRSVTATDNENATVTTVDDRSFITTDAGQTWTRAPGV